MTRLSEMRGPFDYGTHRGNYRYERPLSLAIKKARAHNRLMLTRFKNATPEERAKIKDRAGKALIWTDRELADTIQGMAEVSR